MTAYVVIIRQQTTDADELQQYKAKAPLAREGHAMTPIAFYGKHSLLEGESFEGAAILSFPDVEQAQAWYESPAYEAARIHRKLGSDSRVFIIEGVDL